MAKGQEEADLRGVTIMQGCRGPPPFPNGTFDRYVSTGSIEYWPETNCGIIQVP
jgi:MPBQ/MSBQ methyltransferase